MLLQGDRFVDRKTRDLLLMPVLSASKSCWNADAKLLVPCGDRGLCLISP